jgi:ribosomal protein S13
MIAYDRLSLIIPPDQALANKALQAALQQITGITFTNATVLANAVSNLETTRELPLVEAETQALPSSVYNFYINTFGGNYGTGVDGSITVADVLGAAAGLPYTAQYEEMVSNINELLINSQLTALISIYNTMLDVVDGVYGSGPINIPSGPAAGNYADYDTAFTGNIPPTPGIGLIPAAQAEINTIITNNSTITTALTLESSTVAAAIAREMANQSRANINWGDFLSNSQTSLMAFVNGISNYGLDTTQGGASQMLDNMADQTTLGGQALIAALREARNVVNLGNASIQTATQVSPDPDTVPPQINVSGSKYSEAQAQQKLIF